MQDALVIRYKYNERVKKTSENSREKFGNISYDKKWTLVKGFQGVRCQVSLEQVRLFMIMS